MKNVEKNLRWEAVSDEAGRFRFSYLPAGAYLLSVEQPGFAGASRALTLTVGQALDVPVELSVTQLAEQVSVTTDAPVVDGAHAGVRHPVARGDGLPLNGRTPRPRAPLPCVSRTNTAAIIVSLNSAVPARHLRRRQRHLNNFVWGLRRTTTRGPRRHFL